MMRTVSALVCMFLVGPVSVIAGERIAGIRNEFDHANALYAAHRYDSAATAYCSSARMANAAGDDADSVWTIARDAPYNAACCYARLGRHDDAFAWLDSAVAHGFWDWNFITVDRDLKSLRADSQYILLSRTIAARIDSLERLVRHAPPFVRLPRRLSAPPTVIVLVHDERALPQSAIESWQNIADSTGSVLVAPFGQQVRSPRELSFGLNADSADRYVLASLRTADSIAPVAGRAVLLAGIGTGGTIAMQIAMKHPDLFTGVIAVRGYYNTAYCNRFLSEVRRFGRCIAGVYDPASEMITASILRGEAAMRTACVNTRFHTASRAQRRETEHEIIGAVRWMMDE